MKTNDIRVFPPQVLRIHLKLLYATESDVNQKLGKTHTGYCCLARSSAALGTRSSADFAEKARGQMWLPPPLFELLPRRNDWQGARSWPMKTRPAFFAYSGRAPLAWRRATANRLACHYKCLPLGGSSGDGRNKALKINNKSRRCVCLSETLTSKNVLSS